LDGLEEIGARVLPLQLALRANQRLDVLCIGAHCDDIEIGCGGTLLALQRQYRRLRIHWLILTSDAHRHREALLAAKAFVQPNARGEMHVHDLPMAAPAHFAVERTSDLALP
jgi:LmbE family N-acetylglucosaminyl deacetylase